MDPFALEPPDRGVTLGVAWTMPRLARAVMAVFGIAAVSFLVGLAADCSHAPSPQWVAATKHVLPEASARVQAYATCRRWLYFASMVWSLAGLLLAARCLTPPAARRTASLRHGPATVLVWAGLSVWMALWALPISVADAVVERSFGLSTVTSGTWIADRIRDGALDLVWAPVVAAALVVVRKSPRCWWLWVALGLGPLGAVLTALYPVAVDPLYNRFRPLAEPALRERVLRLAADAGIERPQLLVADSSTRTLKANAYVTGLGPTHRIVIWDTTLRRMANDQVVAIVAHEIGHYRLRHIWWGVALHAVGGIAVLGLAAWILPAVIERWGRSSGVRALYEPAAIPLAYVAFQVLLLAQTPAAAVVSRTMERQADAYGLRLCRNGIATARAFAAFSTLDLGDPDPPRALVAWAHTHPPLRERVARALSFVPKGYIRDGYRAPATPVARRR